MQQDYGETQASIEQALRRRREELKTRRERVRRDLSRAAGPLSQDFADQAIERQNDETLEAIGQAADEEIGQIDRALERIEQGRYGVCESCGEAISPERLRIAPYATKCVSCA